MRSRFVPFNAAKSCFNPGLIEQHLAAAEVELIRVSEAMGPAFPQGTAQLGVPKAAALVE
jgi:hypothetical protein